MVYEYKLPERQSGDEKYNTQLIKWLVMRGYLPKDKNAKILDLASGHGYFYFAMKKLGYSKVVATDKYPQFNECVLGDILDKLPFKDKTFDVVISRDLAEHIIDNERFFKEQNRVLKKGGIIIVMTPNVERLSLGEFYDDFTHVMPYTRKSLYEALKMHGFSKIKVRRLRAIPKLWKYTPRAFDFLFSRKNNNLLGAGMK